MNFCSKQIELLWCSDHEQIFQAAKEQEENGKEENRKNLLRTVTICFFWSVKTQR